MSGQGRPPQQPGIMNEIMKIPPVTRSLVAATVGISGPVMLQLISPYKLLFVWRYVKQGQIWRIPTSFFLSGGGITFLFDLIMLYRNSDALETQWYNGRSADYAYQLLLASGLILALNIPLETFVHYRALLTCLTYLSSRLNPDAPMSIFGLITIKALYFPFALLGLDVLQGGLSAAIISLTGIVAGHVWYMLEWQENGPSRPGGGRGAVVGRPPSWFARFIGNGPRGSGSSGGSGSAAGGGFGAGRYANPRSYGTAVAPPAQDQPTATRRNWGSGNRLGSE